MALLKHALNSPRDWSSSLYLSAHWPGLRFRRCSPAPSYSLSPRALQSYARKSLTVGPVATPSLVEERLRMWRRFSLADLVFVAVYAPITSLPHCVRRYRIS